MIIIYIIYATHPLILIDPCTKYGMPVSKQTEVTDRTRRHEKDYKFDLEVKGQGNIEIINVHPLKVIDACAKYGVSPCQIKK